MSKKMIKTLKSNKGQIGEILVVVVLIILAVLGIVKYVMPMFNKNQVLTEQTGKQMDELAQRTAAAEYGTVGDTVSAQTIINLWDKYMTDTEVTIVAQNAAGTQIFSHVGSATGVSYGSYEMTNTTSANELDRMASYRIISMTNYSSGKVNTITYREVN